MLPRSSRSYETRVERSRPGRRIRQALGLLLALVLAYQLVTAVLLRSVEQQSLNMSPSLAPGDRLLVLPLVYGPRLRVVGWTLPGLRSPARADAVALRPPPVPAVGGFHRIADPFIRFFTLAARRAGEEPGWRSSVQIRRVIGVPGDTVRVERFLAYVRREGSAAYHSEFELAGREYPLVVDPRPERWEPLDPFGSATEEVVVPAGHVFVLADDRVHGLDSRHWGVVPIDALHGKVALRYWPLGRISAVR